MRFKDLTGKTIGRLHVDCRIEDKIDPNGRKRVQYKCTCICGSETIATADALNAGTKQSCGCLRKEILSKQREINLIGQIFGYWTIESEAFRDKNGIHWNAKCKCGNCGTPTTNNLLSGTSTSCGCYNKECISLREKKDITNQRFGIVTAIECVGQNAYQNYLWKCVCDCGTEFIVPASRLLTGQTQSCGCVHSRGEQTIAKILSDNNIKFEKDVMYPDLKLNGLLKFDFRIYGEKNKEYLIEFQGIQHYKEFSNGFGDQQRLITDPMKKEYCKKKNITLYEIRYDEDIIAKISEIIAQVNPVLSLA